LALASASAAYAIALVACGGTTGHEGLTIPDSDSGADATLDAGGGFDVNIMYVDRLLPDLYVAPMEAGGDGGGLPNCPPDLPVLVPLDEAGNPQFLNGPYTVNPEASTLMFPPVGTAVYEVPAVWIDDGGEDLAPDGSACATQVWLGTTACDLCMKETLGGVGGNPWYGEYGNTAILPPCSDLAEAGLAVAGPGANKPRQDLCRAAFDCIVTTRCFEGASGGTCLCKTGDQCAMVGLTGACGSAIQAASEQQGSSPGDTAVKVSQLFGDLNLMPMQVGHAAGALGALVTGLVANCLEACAADAGAE
jgi:hypothetical protein